MSRPRVTVQDLETAAAWLAFNEGEDGEADACQRVAKWLEGEVQDRTRALVRRRLRRGASIDAIVDELGGPASGPLCRTCGRPRQLGCDHHGARA